MGWHIWSFIFLNIIVGVFCVEKTIHHRNAYATMIYMGTPRDYEFYVATRVLLRSLGRLNADADLVVITSLDVPLHWVQTLESVWFSRALVRIESLSLGEQEDGAKVVSVQNLKNPYESQGNFNSRFKLSLNKLYAWSLVDYDRVVMLDADNLFLQNTDELFQCGQFCAVFINPCIFHTGLFVLQPSMDVFKDMVHQLEVARSNPDGADQGFIGGYFPDLLDKPMFNPTNNGTRLDGRYRLPLGYQMDASYYYLRLRWNVPCGPNSVITFPGVPSLKPWYWWSWPLLPLGINWHEQRRQTLGYEAEVPIVLLEVLFYLGIVAVSRMARPALSKLSYRREEKSVFLVQTSLKLVAILSIIAAYTIPFFIIPCTVHPVVGWSLYLLGAFSLSCMAVNVFLLPIVPVLVPLGGTIFTLLTMAYPWYSDGLVRGLAVFCYAFCFSPILFLAWMKILSSLQVSLDRESFLPKLSEYVAPSGFNKLY
ncbi:hypothetical protein Leryth_023183 [Lithospermum erythrorhizon]|nr:hypothetical protein Leryth_023183 [Lithospermum erythrorhizon]